MHVVVSRTGYTAELGFEIYLHEASRHARRLWDRVLEAGAPHELKVIGPCHIRRIEAGILARAGKITSAWYSPRLEKNIGYAMLPIELAGLGTERAVEVPTGRAVPRVVEKPFIDPKKQIPKQPTKQVPQQ
jgi:glycine cleavage system aminomethyltransferase T